MENQQDMEQELVNYYSDLLSELKGEGARDTLHITQTIPRLVTFEHNAILMRPIEREKVEEAVMQMERGKAPGPDNFIVDFFQQCWDLVKVEVWEIVETSQRIGRVLKAFNSTFLTLIPKEQGADSPDKFRPISLCNVVLKIITKVLENRLKFLPPSLISPEQTGFVEG